MKIFTIIFYFTFLLPFSLQFNGKLPRKRPLLPNPLPIKKQDLHTDSTGNFSVTDLPGIVPPLGLWDPLRITKSNDKGMIMYLREAELQHSRLAMLSMIVLPTLEVIDKQDLAINAYDIHYSYILSEEGFVLITALEIARMLIQYESPFVKKFRLKNSVSPGNILKIPNENLSIDMMNKELSNGRLAMIASLGYIVQELVTHQKIIH